MISLMFLTIFLSLGGGVPLSGGDKLGQILQNGEKEVVVNDGKYPYIVYIEITKLQTVDGKETEIDSRCGGVILRLDVILTAAHCIGENPIEVIVWAGILDIEKQKKNGKILWAKEYTNHEEYGGVDVDVNGVYSSNDIGLLWMEESFKETKFIKVAPLAGSDFSLSEKNGWIFGWGLDECGEPSSRLQKAFQGVLLQSECQPYHKSKISKNVICAIGLDQKSGHNFGDSGSPLIIADKVVGLSSFGREKWIKGKNGKHVCILNPKIPGVYTDITKYFDWIDSRLKGVGTRYQFNYE